MISILTTLPKQLVTNEYRYHLAKALSRFLPDGGRPLPINDHEGAYTFDNHNDWWCEVDANNSQLLSITYRDTSVNYKKERALAEWVCANRLGWKIVETQLELRGGTFASVDVGVDVWLPGSYDPEYLESITFDMPTAPIGVFLDSKLVPGAVVTGYTTTTNLEITA